MRQPFINNKLDYRLFLDYMFILYFPTGSQFANWIVMDEECNMPLCEFELEEDDNTEKQSETVEPRKKKKG